MPSSRVVKHFNIIEHITTSFIARSIDFPSDSLSLQQLEKALSHRIIMTISSATHAAFQAMGFEK
jgi:hypothetical protein